MKMKHRLGSGSLISLALLLSTLAPSIARAESRVYFTTRTIQGSPAGSAIKLIPACYMTLGPSWIDYVKRTNGTIYGDFHVNSSISCQQGMAYLWTLSYMTKLPNSQVHPGNAGACGVDSGIQRAIPNCTYVAMSGGIFHCDPCNGTWVQTSVWVMRFGPTKLVVKTDSNNTHTCTATLNGKYTCSGDSQPLTLR